MATVFLKVKNRALSTLASGISNSDLSLTVATGEGVLFPLTYPFHITIEDEILVCTNRSTDTLTVTRAAEGTSAAAHITGKAVSLRITAQLISDLNSAVNAIENDKSIANGYAGLNANLRVIEIPQIANKVTVKSGAATLTLAEAGLILVSAASAYTITLPTAVGHTGLTYHFVKTDANYNLITLDGDGTETFNYPNDDGVAKTTYPRLNTYGAEVTVVSDGSNWQVINEKLGQVPECKVQLNNAQYNLTDNVNIMVLYDAKVYDIGSNYDMSTWESGNATSTSAGHLVDTNANFVAGMVGVRVRNTTDTTETYITAVNSATDISVRDDIFISGEAYEIKNSKFVCPIPGRYEIMPGITWMGNSVVANSRYTLYTHKNTTYIDMFISHSALVQYLSNKTVTIDAFGANDEITFWAKSNSGDNTANIDGNTYVNAVIKLISKD